MNDIELLRYLTDQINEKRIARGERAITEHQVQEGLAMIEQLASTADGEVNG